MNILFVTIQVNLILKNVRIYFHFKMVFVLLMQKLKEGERIVSNVKVVAFILILKSIAAL